MIDYMANENFDNVEPEIRAYMAQNGCSYRAALLAIASEQRMREYSRTAQLETRDKEYDMIRNHCRTYSKDFNKMCKKIDDVRSQYGSHFPVEEIFKML